MGKDVAGIYLSRLSGEGVGVMRRNEDQARAIRNGTSSAMRRSATSRQCPKCQRKAAIKKTLFVEERLTVKVCRWCDYREETAWSS